MFGSENRSSISRVVLRRAVIRAFALMVTSVLLSTAVSAQRYKSIQPKLEERAARALRAQAAAAMRNVAAYQAGGAQKIEEYFKTVYFPQMTQTDIGSLSGLGKRREDLIKYLRGTTVPAAQEQLTKLSLTVMRAVARDRYHPSVRYNATLVLGMLDQQYAGVGGSSTPPAVLPEGTNELLELLEQNEFNDVKVHPSVKVGALEGLDRHLRFGLDDQYAERVTQAAMAVLQQEPSTLDVDADVNNWMKCQAAKVLARQFAQSPNAEVHSALTKLIADEKMSLADRCCVVGLLEKIEFGNAAGLDLGAALPPLGSLTKAVVAEGAEKAQEYKDLRLGKGPRRVSGSFGRRGAREPKLERRRLLASLTQIEKGADSLSAGLPDELKQKVKELTDALQPAMEISRDTKALDLDVMGEVLKLEDSVNNVLASWQPADAAEPEDEEEFVE